MGKITIEIDSHCSIDPLVVFSQLQYVNPHPIPTALFGYFVTTRMGATRIGFLRPAGFDLGLRNSGVHISGPEFEISRPEFRFAL